MFGEPKRKLTHDKFEITLDGVEHRFHVRERDNRVAIILSQPGWAAATNYDYWYVSIADLPTTTSVWTHRGGSTHHGGVTYSAAIEILKKWYAEEAVP